MAFVLPTTIAPPTTIRRRRCRPIILRSSSLRLYRFPSIRLKPACLFPACYQRLATGRAHWTLRHRFLAPALSFTQLHHFLDQLCPQLVPLLLRTLPMSPLDALSSTRSFPTRLAVLRSWGSHLGISLPFALPGFHALASLQLFSRILIPPACMLKNEMYSIRYRKLSTLYVQSIQV
jgi:hypothetical protein